MTAIIILAFLFMPAMAPGAVTLYILRTPEEVNMLSWYNIDYWLQEYGVRQPEVVKAQIRLETGNLTSRFCRECNNLFGMRKPRKRQTTAIGENNRMSVYSSWRESIKDYAIWQGLYYDGGDYYQFLARHGYATDPGYIRKLRNLQLD